MTTQQIGYFLKLAEELNYTKVAQLFFITQPTLSKQIVNLENELKITLFSRDHNTVKLTPAGKRFYERVKPVFQDLMDVIRDAQSFDEDKETLSIGIQEEQIISDALSLAINDLRSEYPDLVVSIHRANMEELMNGLETGKYDVLNLLGNVIEASSGKGYLDRYEFLKLESEGYYLAYSRHISGIPETLTQKDLSEILSRYDLIFPVLRDAVNDEQVKDFFISNMPGIDADKVKIHVTQSGRPISLPTQVASQLGVTLSNRTNMFSIDPEIRLARILDTEDSYHKGLLYIKRTSNKYIPILMDFVKQQMLKING